jgi:hypothetical protein
MSIQIRPVPSRNTLSLIDPVDGMSFRHNELRKLSSTKRWTLEKIETSNPWLTIKFTDSRNNVNRLEVFNRNYTKVQCTCGQFVSDESNFCMHAAAFDNLCKNRTKFSDYRNPEFVNFTRDIDAALLRLPEKLNGYRNTHFNFYNAYKQHTRSFGNSSLPVINSVTVLANERRELRANENADSIIVNPSDEGLLNGVNLFNYQKNIFAKMVTASHL